MCAIYSRGEIPPWIRDWSPLDDLTFIRNMTTSEQASFTNMIPAPGLAVFMAASTEAELQKREQAEVQKHLNNGTTPPWCHASHGDNSNRDRLERFQTSLVTASSLPSLETTIRARRERPVTQIQRTNSFALLEAQDDEEDDRNEEADQYDSDEETTRIFLQQPGAGATVRTMQPTFPPAPEFQPPTMVADPASAVRALDRVPWDDLITPANLTTMREVPSELQGDLLEAMRDILKNLNDALEGSEVEFERWYKLWELFPLLFLRMPPRGGRRGHGLIASRLEAHKQRNYGQLLDWYFNNPLLAGNLA